MNKEIEGLKNYIDKNIENFESENKDSVKLVIEKEDVDKYERK